MVADSLVFPNFDRHNGNSSKKRSLTNDRVAKMRTLKQKSGAICNAQWITGVGQKVLPDEDEEQKKEIKDKYILRSGENVTTHIQQHCPAAEKQNPTIEPESSSLKARKHR